jgi:4,5-dihydroxyphthalate decarboxylase
MAHLRLTFACGDYDRTRGLWDGSVRPEGIELNYLRIHSGEGFWRQLQWQEFDASEISMSNLIMAVARGDRRFVGIPAFTSRAFRHNGVFVNSTAGITQPQDLKGRRIGVAQYSMTAALWIRGFLHHDYGVTADDVEWFQGGLEKPGYPERVHLQLPPSIRVTYVADRALYDMLLDGELDAVIGFDWPDAFRSGDPRIAPLFPNWREVEREYYCRTRYFPIMHGVALLRDVYEQHRWAAQNLYRALVQAKNRAVRQLSYPDALKSTLPWAATEHLETTRLMGEDYWRYGVEASRHELEAMCQYSYEQGLSERVVDVEELFAPETLKEFPRPREP